MNVGQLVLAAKIARTALDWNQDKAAKMIGIPKSSLARLETFDTNPSMEFLMKVLDTYSKAGVQPVISTEGVTFLFTSDFGFKYKDKVVNTGRRSDRKKV